MTATEPGLKKWLAERKAAEWEADLSAAGIPCGMVRDIAEAVSLPGLDARQLRLPLTIAGLPDREQVEVLGSGVLGGTGDDGSLEPPPALGEHTEEILNWLDREGGKKI